MSGSAHHRYLRRQDPLRGAKSAKFEFVLHLSAPRYAKPKQLGPSRSSLGAREIAKGSSGVAGSRRPVVESAATSINLIANGGADDARPVDDANLLGLIASAILERPTCLDCLDAKVEAPTLSVVRTVDRIGKRSRQQRAVRRLWQHGGADIFAEASAIADRQERQHPAWSRQALPQNVARQLRSVEILDIRRRRRTAY
jgi:hypothetical protein